MKTAHFFHSAKAPVSGTRNSSPQTKKSGICTDCMVKSLHVRANCDLKCAPSSGRIDSDEGRTDWSGWAEHEERTSVRLRHLVRNLFTPNKKATAKGDRIVKKMYDKDNMFSELSKLIKNKFLQQRGIGL